MMLRRNPPCLIYKDAVIIRNIWYNLAYHVGGLRWIECMTYFLLDQGRIYFSDIWETNGLESNKAMEGVGVYAETPSVLLRRGGGGICGGQQGHGIARYP